MRQKCDERRVHSLGRIALTPPGGISPSDSLFLSLQPGLVLCSLLGCLQNKQGPFSGRQPGQVARAKLESPIQQIGAYFGSKNSGELELEPRTLCVFTQTFWFRFSSEGAPDDPTYRLLISAAAGQLHYGGLTGNMPACWRLSDILRL